MKKIIISKMKRNNHHIILNSITLLMTLLLLSTASCTKDFLEIAPKGKLIAQKISDYDLLLNNSNLLNTGGANAQVFLGDEIAAAEQYLSVDEPRTQRLFKWEPVIYESNENAPEIASMVSQLYTYNKIINEVMDASGGTEQQKKSIRAEAQAGRAWVNFMLINYFGKPYNTATSATDAGFPIIDKADVTETQFARATVAEVYDLIVEDLLEAIPNLPQQTTYRIRMSKVAGESLLGKVYVFMGKYSDALPLFNNALSGIQNSAIPVNLVNYNEAFAEGGLFMPINPTFGPSTPVINNNPETIYARQFSNFWVLSSTLVISPATVSLFNQSDLRLKFYSTMPFPFGDEYPSGTRRRVGPLTTSYGVVLPEVILLRAECRARLNDLTGCAQDLENLRRNRMPAEDAIVPSSISGQKQTLLQFVMDERIREYACQGIRWYDMRRLSVDPLFSSLQFKHLVYGENGSVQELPMPAERLVLKIPPKILAENPGMQDNP